MININEFFKSFVYALNGIHASLKEQRNLKVQAIIALIIVGAGFYFDITSTEWCLILLSIALVIGLEIMNSGIEGLVDLVTQERKLLAGKVKDVAAGAVLFASVITVVIGVIIFRKYLLI
jgi:diacylglycerol kinase